jgi:hypothetical protein
LLGLDLVGGQSFIISIVPLANKFRDDMVWHLREVASQVVESIVSTPAGRHKDDMQVDCIDEF